MRSMDGSRTQCRLAVEVCENRRSSIKGGKKEKADIITVLVAWLVCAMVLWKIVWMEKGRGTVR